MLAAVLPLIATTAEPPPRRLSDADLVAIEKSRFDRGAKMNRTERLGVHRGVFVVADYPCSDLCPAHTVRILHYAVAPGAACAKAGGVTRQRMVPVSIAIAPRPFCVPAVIAGAER